MKMSIDDAILRYYKNAEYELNHENLQGYLEFLQLAKWLEQLQRIEHIIGSGNTALRVYNNTLDECTCGNCLGYINKGYNYCPQCGARLED